MPKKVLWILLFGLFFMTTIPAVFAQDAAIQTIVDKAVETANAAIPTLGKPNNWEWEKLAPVSNSALSCPFATGTTLPNTVTPYKITLIYGAERYVVFVSADTSVVQLCDPKFSALPTITPGGPTTTPTPNVTATPTPIGYVPPCALSPLGAFSNVRSAPSTDAAIVEVIYENSSHPVQARNTVGDWYLIPQGWVSITVSKLSENCANLPTSDVVIVAGTQAAPISASVTCPANFAGYLPPRIQVGQVTAQVETGGVPNRLREQPATNALLRGEVQPGRRFDAVLRGPACNEGFVWWEVTIDGITGWTAESNAATGEYYISPVAGTETLAPGRVLVSAQRTPITSIAFSPDGKTLASTNGRDTFIQRWSLETDTALTVNPTHTASLGWAVYRPDSTLVGSDFSGAVRLWSMADASAFTEILQVTDVKFGVEIVFSPDGMLMAAKGCATPGQLQDCVLGKVMLWDVNTGALLRTMQGHPNAVFRMAFSPDGKLLATSSQDGVWIWDVVTGANLRVFPGNGNPVNAVQFSPDRKTLAAASCAEAITHDNVRTCNLSEVRFWNLETNAVDKVFTQPNDVWDVAFSPDGQLLATAGQDTIARVFDVASGSEVQKLEGHNKPVRHVIFSPDGTLLASASDDGTIRLWPVQIAVG